MAYPRIQIDPKTAERILIDCVRAKAAVRIQTYALRDLTLDVIESMADELVYQINAQIEARKDVSVTYHEPVPATWWDAVKQRFFPKRLLEYFPAQTIRLPYTQTTTYSLPPRPETPAPGYPSGLLYGNLPVSWRRTG